MFLFEQFEHSKDYQMLVKKQSIKSLQKEEERKMLLKGDTYYNGNILFRLYSTSFQLNIMKFFFVSFDLYSIRKLCESLLSMISLRGSRPAKSQRFPLTSILMIEISPQKRVN